MSRKKVKGSFSVCLPDKKRPFIYGTESDNDFLNILTSYDKTFNEMKNTYKNKFLGNNFVDIVLEKYIEAGYGDEKMSKYFFGGY